MALEMRVKVTKRFINPLTNRMAVIDEERNVPCNPFWQRRVDQGDCKKLSQRPIQKATIKAQTAVEKMNAEMAAKPKKPKDKTPIMSSDKKGSK